MHEGRFCPTLADDAHHLFERLAVAFLVLDRRAVWAAKRFVFARLIATAHAAFDAPAADNVELGDLFSQPHRMVPNHDIRALTEANPFGLRRDRHLGEQRVRTHLRPFRLKMMLRQPEGLVSKLLGENALAHLVHQHLLRCGMHLGQRTVVHRHAILGNNHRQVRRTVMEYTDLEHCLPSSLRFLFSFFASITYRHAWSSASQYEKALLQQSTLRIPDTIRTGTKSRAICINA